MAQELNATCDICGKKYHLCKTCQNATSFNPWRVITDTLPHYMIFLAISEYTKTKDKEKAQSALSQCDLSDLETFNDNITNVINEIMTVVTSTDEAVTENTEENNFMEPEFNPVPIRHTNRKRK